MNGFVYIIESPSADDLLDGRTEGRALNEVLDLAEIPRWYSLVTNKNTLQEALGQRLWEAWQDFQVPPVLHLSMHGNQYGVQLTNKESISWNQLRYALLPLTRAMNGGLLICMSTCFGSFGNLMAMYEDNEQPFGALIGSTNTTAWPDAAVAYITFYHLFFKGTPLESCVDAMKRASGDCNFTWHSGHQTKWQWITHMQQINNLNHRIEQAVAQSQEW